MSQLDRDALQHTANVVRGLAMDAVERARSGHPGMPMGTADMAVLLWSRFLRFDPAAPDWAGRDRFVLSAGHGSMLLYSLLHLSGYEVSLDDLRAFRQWHSKTPGHPELGETPGVETTTGPLGQGFGNGVGMALGAKMAAARFDHSGLEARVFGIVSDGDLMEGVAHEAASLAGHLRLDNLVYLYDDNRITIDGRTDLTFTEDVEARFAALGWFTTSCDGHDFGDLERALTAAVAADRPALVRCRTTIGKGSPNKQDTSASHGSPLGAEEIALAKEALGLPAEEFWAPDSARAPLQAAAARGAEARREWELAFASWREADAARAQAFDRFAARQVPSAEALFATLHAAVADGVGATRALSGQVIQALATEVPGLVGGSADLDGSTKTRIVDADAVQTGRFGGRNLHFGVREHGMGSILNGLAQFGGFLPMGSTFLVFADYMRPTIRLAALMGLPVTYVFTHDSLMVGEDGPTHQPVEQTASLRLIPNLDVWRPADAAETAAAWAAAATRRDGPTALILTRQSLPAIDTPADADAALRGAWVVQDHGDAKATLLATGSEVHVAIEAAALLSARDCAVRVVSMPCADAFARQSPSYRDGVLPPGGSVIAIEMGERSGWCRWTGGIEKVIGLDGYGASAPAAELARQFGFTAEAVAEQVATILEG